MYSCNVFFSILLEFLTNAQLGIKLERILKKFANHVKIVTIVFKYRSKLMFLAIFRLMSSWIFPTEKKTSLQWFQWNYISMEKTAKNWQFRHSHIHCILSIAKNELRTIFYLSAIMITPKTQEIKMMIYKMLGVCVCVFVAHITSLCVHINKILTIGSRINTLHSPYTFTHSLKFVSRRIVFLFLLQNWLYLPMATIGP